MNAASPASKVLRYLLIFVILLCLLAAGWVWITLHWAYSEGERTGYIQKLSNKGWVCKTWEGEIALVTMPGAIPEKFEFTVRDEAMAARINAASGKRVVLHYRQHKFIPSSCFGETEYFVDDIREPADSAAIPAPSVQQGAFPGLASPSAASQPAPAR
ncbi:MAG TPA: hypothetical protein VIU46_03165 [Gallionellaceae bacterium]